MCAYTAYTYAHTPGIDYRVLRDALHVIDIEAPRKKPNAAALKQLCDKLEARDITYEMLRDKVSVYQVLLVC